MAGINKVILIGNLGADPEIRTLESGIQVATISLATTENYRDKNGERQSHTEWHRVVLWRGLAKIAEDYLKKGSQVYIEGRLRTRSYEDQEGKTRYVTEIEGRDMVMLSRRTDDQGHNIPPPQSPVGEKASSSSETQKDNGQEADASDDLPF